MALLRVRKRDGREVPFDAAKIEGAVGRACSAAGEEDGTLPGAVASVVCMALEQRYGRVGPGQEALASRRDAAPVSALPEIEEIQDLVEQALIELGNAAVAKAYILYRDRRRAIREELQVQETRAQQREEDSGASAKRSLVRVQATGGSERWSKGRIVAALMNEANLSRRVAGEVAARVEERVFSAGLRRVSTALIRELVDNELVVMGLSGALRRQALIGVPRHDLRRALEEGVGRASEPFRVETMEAWLSGELMKRYVQEEVFDESTVEHHLRGDLDISGFPCPHRFLSVAVPAPVLTSGACDAESAFEVLGELARMARQVASGLVLEDCGALLKALQRGKPGNRSVGTWLRALSALAEGSGARIDLLGPGSRYLAQTARLIADLARMPRTSFTPRVFLDTAELGGLLDQHSELAADLNNLLDEHIAVASFSRAPERYAGPACARHPHERAAISCGGAVALNLPRLAWRAGPWREDRMLELLEALVLAALGALESLSSFQLRCGAARPFELRGRVVYALVPVGLSEALRLLGDGEARVEQGARLLGLLCDAARAFGEARRMAVYATPFFGEAAAVRFAELDADLPHQAQRLLFAEGIGPGIERGAAYSAGYLVAAPRGVDLGQHAAELLATVPSGALYPFPRSSSGAAGPLPGASRSWTLLAELGASPPVEVWRSFESARTSQRMEGAWNPEVPSPPRKPNLLPGLLPALEPEVDLQSAKSMPGFSRHSPIATETS